MKSIHCSEKVDFTEFLLKFRDIKIMPNIFRQINLRRVKFFIEKVAFTEFLAA